ncbi:MAG TPA: hypothetical protein VEK79_15430 [Thermoanaerobaculia bacterium]|nr:hypothetical protein [Thermoanaerobaculia bacterium]
MRILSKTHITATALALALLSGACARVLPWRDDVVAPEVNLAFTLERNLVELQTVRLDNRAGRFLLGSAAPRTVVDPSFATSGRHLLQLTEKESVRISPSQLDLGGVADAIIGIEPWRARAITIDYRSGLVTYQKDGIHTGYMKIFRYDDAPMINVNVNGREVAAIVDTTSPDTIVLPRTQAGRGTAHIVVGDTDFGTIDVGYANIARARVGNRVLSRFMVTIDYGRKVVGLWRDPRIPL